jgi:hypothetical protein
MGGSPPKNHQRGNGGSRGTPALLFTHSLALACGVGREMLNEHIGVVLKDVMDSKGIAKASVSRSTYVPCSRQSFRSYWKAARFMPVSMSLSISA